MAKRMLIDAAHPEETRVVVLSGHRLEEFDFETSTKKQIKGNIYLAKVTRVEPSLQAAFVEYGGNRHGFLAFNEIHPDYYRIPVGDRRAQEARDARHRELVEEARRAEAAENGEEGLEENEFEPPHEIELAHEAEPPHEAESALDGIAGEGAPAGFEPPSDPAALAAAAGMDVLYEAHDESHEPAAEAPELTGAAAIGPEPGPFESAAEHAEAEPGAAPEHPAAEAHAEGGVYMEEAAPVAAETIETVGGDEIEEAPRQRRPFRHYKIQEVIKRRQIMLVQVTKEERGNKGAALTTFLSLAGRYCVLMPNTPRGGGVSRKITNSTDRRRLKDLMSDLDVPEGMGVIVRTAGSERSKAEIKRDFEYLQRLWDEIRDLTLKSTAPALIYEEGNLIKRSIRDLYTRDIEEVLIDGEEGYHTAKAFMKMLMPSHTKRIKPYRDPSVPLFHRFQVETQIDAIHSPVVQLRSGGYIVINPTEALVSIDVNSGRSTRERNIEETALKTNLEAAEEIARQLRLRDLAGLIVIDFIDMEEHRNQGAVERKLKDALRHDRARIQVGRISPFGLLEMSRQRLRPSLLEASTQPCPHCNGTGHIRSTESTALHVLRAIEEEGMRRRSAEISVAVPAAVALYILNHKRETLVQAEKRYGFRVAIGSDDTLIPPAFRLERLRALTPAEIAALPPPVVPVAEPEEEEEEFIEEEEAEARAPQEAAEQPETEAQFPLAAQEGAPPRVERAEGENGHGRRRRRRRRRGRHEEGREAGPRPPMAHEGTGREGMGREVMPMMPPPLQDVTAPLGDMGEEEAYEAEFSGEAEAEEPQHQPPGDVAGEPGGGRKRRRRGRRGGRRRRRGGEPGQESQGRSAEPEMPATPFAERVEYVPPPSRETPPTELEAAFEATPMPSAPALGVENVPIGEPGDQPAAAAADDTETAPRHVASAELPTHDVTGSPANPKRGWWRRVIDR
ncbi:MAG TPA: ribonuclease E/G [Stellaceae bacterium]|nr:ribonuclease E/G [Stellaceae bacterium]